MKAQKEYNWDGYRWDWYGLPENYVCDGTSAACNFSSEMAPLVNRLDLAVKEIRADVTTTALQLPSTSGNIPHYTTGAVANHQFMELWPFGTGTKYTDLYRDIYEAKSRYPDKPVFANFYPPAEMNLTTGWPYLPFCRWLSGCTGRRRSGKLYRSRTFPCCKLSGGSTRTDSQLE